MKATITKKEKTDLVKLINNKKHELYLFETAHESHIGEKRMIPNLINEIEALENRLSEIKENYMIK